MRHVVLRLDPLHGLGHRSIEVALSAHDLARPTRGSLKLRTKCGRIVRGVRSGIPCDLELVAALDRCPGILGYHRNTAERLELGWNRCWLDGDDLHDTRDRHCLGRIERGDLTAIHWRAGHDGVEHTVDAGIDAVGGFAGGDVAVVDQTNVTFADVAERRGLLQPHALARRHRQLRRILGQRAVAQRPP